jgi:hypothetical protein
MNIFRKIFNFFYEIFFGCTHDRLTRPFTLQEETYKVCLDCGAQIYYSPVTMRPLSAREIRRMKATRAGELKVVPVKNGPALVPSPRGKSSAA